MQVSGSASDVTFSITNWFSVGYAFINFIDVSTPVHLQLVKDLTGLL